MLQGAMLIWFILTLLSVVFVLWDSVTNGVTSWVQRTGWILVTIYTGPFGAFMYLMACRRPFPGGHDRFTESTWKQGVNSEVHCLAGDATGIIIASAIVPAFALANGWDILIEYLAGFVTGLFIFQALMMLGMYSGDYIKAVRKTFFAETVSMNMVMLGMIPVMVILEALWPDSTSPARPEFWFRMSLASVVGGIIAFPVNCWLVKDHLKHGCMTLPGADVPAPGLGHRSAEPAMMHEMAMVHEPDQGTHNQMHGQHAGSPAGMEEMSHKDTGHGTGHESHAMKMRELPLGVSVLWIFGTYAFLIAAIWLTAQWVPISFS
jgi:hypothetical protein